MFNKEMLSSVHINFLFGAGVNGNDFPQLNGFTKTLGKMRDLGVSEELGFEGGIDALEIEERESVKEIFISEFKDFEKEINYKGLSIKNIELMLSKTEQIVANAQNRTNSMNQVNIYTLNYDNIVEEVLQRRGIFYNSVSAKNINENARLMNVVGYDYITRKCLPSFLVSKLHGDIAAPIIPGKEKYKEILDENYFEIAFNMKEHLSRRNSILIVIGYSGNDKHVNKILQDCVANGLIIYWYKYSINDTPKEIDLRQIYIKEQLDYENPRDTTEICFEDMCEIWEEKLEE